MTFGKVPRSSSSLLPRGDRASFIYLGELYECGADLLRSALIPQGSGGDSSSAPASANRQERVQNAEPKRPVSLIWEPLESNEGLFSRARVPGGWLVSGEGRGIVFVPDESRVW